MMGAMPQEMDRMHAGEPQPPLVSRLLDGDRLTEAQRRALRTDAEMRRDEGLRQIERATQDLAQARQAGDDAVVARAVTGLKEGAVRWETGTTVLRALESKTPREAGVQWFRAQMRTRPRVETETAAATFSWPHVGAMIGLAATVAVGLLLYAYKVRRSIDLLRRLGHDPVRPDS